jgi:hypothetical protein
MMPNNVLGDRKAWWAASGHDIGIVVARSTRSLCHLRSRRLHDCLGYRDLLGRYHRRLNLLVNLMAEKFCSWH